MAGIKVKTISVDINSAEIKKRLGDKLVANLSKMNKVAAEDSNKYVRVATGNLRDSLEIQDDGFDWALDYAEYPYYDLDSYVYKGKNPNAHAEWFEHAKKVHLQEWIKVAKEGIK